MKKTLEPLFIHLAWLVLPKKYFRKFISDKRVMVPNPLRNQKFLYKKCGCGSSEKVRFCCGKPRMITVEKYKIFARVADKWLAS